MSIRMAPGMARLTVLGKGWNDNAVIDSGDGFTVDEGIWGGDEEIWDGDALRFTVRTKTNTSFIFRLHGDVTVDWGDGKVNSYSCHELRPEEHFYGVSDTEYTVSITGDLKNISFCFDDIYGGNTSGYCAYQQVTAVITPFPASMGAVEKFDYLFYDCRQLTSLPKGLFKNCPNAKSFRYAFAGSRTIMSNGAILKYPLKLTELPKDLFSYCPLAENFAFCFSVCCNLTEIPEELFAKNHKVTSFASCFKYGEKITSALPALWETHSGANGSDCFYGCTRAANYESVPATWR